jgi:DNA-binding MarR family transcriptional regulator
MARRIHRGEAPHEYSVAAVAVDSEPERLGLRYLTLAYQVRKVVDKHMISSGLSLARWKVLEILDAKGSIRQKALAQELGFAERSVSQAVESLAGDGLVGRMPDPADGRAKLVTLTDEGAAALAAADKAGAEVLQRIFGTLDRKQLASLDKLLNVIDDAAGETDQGTPAVGRSASHRPMIVSEAPSP